MKERKWQREYHITRCSLGYNIYRVKKEKNWIMHMERLQRDTYTLNKDHARTFYNLDDATSALVIERTKWESKRTPTTFIRKSESEDTKEKKSWSEL